MLWSNDGKVMSVHALNAVLKTVTWNRRRGKSRDEEDKGARELPPAGDRKLEEPTLVGKSSVCGVEVWRCWTPGIEGLKRQRAEREGGARGEPGLGGRELRREGQAEQEATEVVMAKERV